VACESPQTVKFPVETPSAWIWSWLLPLACHIPGQYGRIHGHTDRPQGIAVLSLLAFVSLFCSAFIALTLHELAHAITGHLAGLNIRRIRIGTEPILLRFRAFHTDIQIGLLPTGGGVDLYRPLRPSRRRRLAFVAAGPLMDMVWFCILIWLMTQSHENETANAVLMPALVVQICMLISSLYPCHAHFYGERLPSDMLHFYRILREKDDPAEFYLKAYFVRLAGYHKDDLSSLIPSRGSERVAHIYLERMLDKKIDRRAHVEALLREIGLGLSPLEEVAIIDGLITDAIRHPPTQYESELDALSARAITLYPDLKTLKGSRAAVLARAGRHQEALELLEQAEYERVFDRSLNTAFRALALFHAGRQEDARAALDQSVRILREDEPNWRHGQDILQIVGQQIGYWPDFADDPPEPEQGTESSA
jgi:hypothetical protein